MGKLLLNDGENILSGRKNIPGGRKRVKSDGKSLLLNISNKTVASKEIGPPGPI
jgi:hypothetical protein